MYFFKMFINRLFYEQVFTRYLLQKIFGPSLLKLTGDDSALYLDLPSNIVCLTAFVFNLFDIHQNINLKIRCLSVRFLPHGVVWCDIQG